MTIKREIGTFVIKDNFVPKKKGFVGARNKKLDQSSRKWIERHINDEYVFLAEKKGYRARSSFKLCDIDDRFNILKDVKNVLDLGSAPGGWLQVIFERVSNPACIVGLDLLEIEDIGGADFLVGDFNDPEMQKKIVAICPLFDLILSDIAPNTSGVQDADVLRLNKILHEEIEFCEKFLRKGGSFVAKAFIGIESEAVLLKLKLMFSKVRYFKPSSSRKESKEVYLVCLDKK